MACRVQDQVGPIFIQDGDSCDVKEQWEKGSEDKRYWESIVIEALYLLDAICYVEPSI